jgi:hypothetical protein
MRILLTLGMNNEPAMIKSKPPGFNFELANWARSSITASMFPDEVSIRIFLGLPSRFPQVHRLSTALSLFVGFLKETLPATRFIPDTSYRLAIDPLLQYHFERWTINTTRNGPRSIVDRRFLVNTQLFAFG